MSERSGKLLDVLQQELRLRNYSPKTIKAYKSCVRTFIRWIAPRHPRDLGDYEIRDVFTEMLDSYQRSPAGLNQLINALRFLYVELYQRPMRLGTFQRPRAEKKLPVILSEEEVIRLLEVIKNVKHKTILMLIYSGGLRVGEAVRIKIADIDSDRMLIHINEGKGKKDRYTLITGLKELRKGGSEREVFKRSGGGG